MAEVTQTGVRLFLLVHVFSLSLVPPVGRACREAADKMDTEFAVSVPASKWSTEVWT